MFFGFKKVLFDFRITLSGVYNFKMNKKISSRTYQLISIYNGFFFRESGNKVIKMLQSNSQPNWNRNERRTQLLISFSKLIFQRSENNSKTKRKKNLLHYEYNNTIEVKCERKKENCYNLKCVLLFLFCLNRAIVQPFMFTCLKKIRMFRESFIVFTVLFVSFLSFSVQ